MSGVLALLNGQDQTKNSLRNLMNWQIEMPGEEPRLWERIRKTIQAKIVDRQRLEFLKHAERWLLNEMGNEKRPH